MQSYILRTRNETSTEKNVLCNKNLSVGRYLMSINETIFNMLLLSVINWRNPVTHCPLQYRRKRWQWLFFI